MIDGGGESDLGTRVGRLLCDYRIKRRYDLGTVSQILHIRQSFLEAIEAGRYDVLPGPVYAAGFVRTYAEFLGLDADEVVRHFKGELADRGRAAPLNFPAPMSEGSTPKGGVLLLGAIIAIVAYAGWYVLSSRDIDVAELVAPVPERLQLLLGGSAGLAEQRGGPPSGNAELFAAFPPAGRTGVPLVPPAADAPGLGEESAASAVRPGPAAPGPTESEIGSVTAPPATPDPPVVAQPRPGAAAPLTTGASQPAAQAAEAPAAASIPGDGSARIVLQAKADSWVELRDPESGTQVAARLLKAGDVYAIPNRPGLRLVTGNAGGLIVLVDGQVAPALGRDGAVRRGIPLDADVLRRGLEHGPAQ